MSSVLKKSVFINNVAISLLKKIYEKNLNFIEISCYFNATPYEENQENRHLNSIKIV